MALWCAQTIQTKLSWESSQFHFCCCRAEPHSPPAFPQENTKMHIFPSTSDWAQRLSGLGPLQRHPEKCLIFRTQPVWVPFHREHWWVGVEAAPVNLCGICCFLLPLWEALKAQIPTLKPDPAASKSQLRGARAALLLLVCLQNISHATYLN